MVKKVNPLLGERAASAPTFSMKKSCALSLRSSSEIVSVSSARSGSSACAIAPSRIGASMKRVA
jgi:hypothetical protein